MSFLRFELDAFSGAGITAGLLGIDHRLVTGGLLDLWVWAWREGVDEATAAQVAGAFGPATPRDRLIEALEAGGFVEPLEGGRVRIRGVGQYLRVSDRRAEAGRRGASKRWQTDGKRIANGSQTDGNPVASDGIDPRSEILDLLLDSPLPPSENPPGPDPSEQPEDPDPVEAAFGCWNVHASPDFPRAAKLTDARKKAIRRALELVPLESWPLAIGALNRWPWAHGDGQRAPRDWRPSLDWFLAKDQHGTPNILRASEGQFGSAAGGGAPMVPVESPPPPLPEPKAVESAAYERILSGLTGLSQELARQLVPVADGDELVLSAPNAFVRDWLDDHRGALDALAGKRVRVADRVPDERAVS